MINQFNRGTVLLSAILIFVLLSFSSCNNQKGSEVKDDAEWMSLFNGKDLDGWIVKAHHHDVNVNVGNTFRVEHGMIQVRYDHYDEFNNQFAHLYYKTPFSHFHLKLEYHFTGELQKGAPDYTILNSGVMYHAQDPNTILKEQDWPISVEMQFLAGIGDGNPRPTGNMCSPGTDIVYQGKIYDGHCLNSSSETFEKEAWVSAELIVLGDSLITHIINGDTVLRYSKPTMGGGVIKGYDSTLWQVGKPLRAGYIALQSEGQPIDFRNIKLKNLE